MVDPFQQCPFKVLKLPVTATEDEITRKWKQLVLKNHPDKNPGEHAKENTQVLNDAKDKALKHAQDAREYRNRLLEEEKRKKRKQEEERKQKEYYDKKMKQWEDNVQKEVDEIIKNALNADRIRREKEETRKREEETRKREEETRKREEETRKRRQEDEKMLREKEEKKKREEEEVRKRRQEEEETKKREKEEECTRLLETIWPFLVYGMDNVNDRTYLMFRMIQDKVKEHIDTKREGKKLEPLYDYAAMYDMAKELNKRSIEAQNAKTNTERLESALAEAKKELDAERKKKAKEDDYLKNLAQHISKVETQLDNERKAKDDANQQLTEAKKKIDTDCKIKDDLHQRLSEATRLLDAERRAKDDLARRLSEATTLLDCERKKAKNDLKKCMSEAAILLDNERKSKDDANQRLKETTTLLETKHDIINQSLSEVTKRLNDEIQAKNEVKQQLDEMKLQLDAELKAGESARAELKRILTPLSTETEESVDIQPSSKKQKTNHTSTKSNQLNCLNRENINMFIEKRLVLKTGHFTATALIQDSFVKEYLINSATFPEKAFQMMLKECFSSKFKDSDCIVASRTQHAGDRSRGYTGLMLLTATNGV